MWFIIGHIFDARSIHHTQIDISVDVDLTHASTLTTLYTHPPQSHTHTHFTTPIPHTLQTYAMTHHTHMDQHVWFVHM